MNKARRANLDLIHSKLLELTEELETLMSEEEEYRDNMPENMQSGEKYEQSEEYSYSMEEAKDRIIKAVERAVAQ